MAHHQRREVEDWLNLFEQQKQSGLTAVAFCRQQQINVQTYYTRRRDIRLQRTHYKFVHVKHEVTKIESHTEKTGGELLLQLGNAQLSASNNQGIIKAPNLILYSIIETAKANDLNVFEYVMTCLDELSQPDVNIEQRLPWQFAKR